MSRCGCTAEGSPARPRAGPCRSATTTSSSAAGDTRNSPGRADGTTAAARLPGRAAGTRWCSRTCDAASQTAGSSMSTESGNVSASAGDAVSSCITTRPRARGVTVCIAKQHVLKVGRIVIFVRAAEAGEGWVFPTTQCSRQGRELRRVGIRRKSGQRRIQRRKCAVVAATSGSERLGNTDSQPPTHRPSMDR